MTWTKTGTDTYWNKTSSQTAVTVAAGTTGDLRVIEFLTASSSVSVSSLSGGGVTTWTRARGVDAVSSSTLGTAMNSEVWYGQITGSGTALTVTYAGTVGSTSCRGRQRDYRTNRSGSPTYSVVATGFSQTNNHTSSSPLAWPSLTTKGSDELFVGVMGNFGGPTYTGATAGFTYDLDGDGNQHVYKLSCNAAEVEAPTSTFTGTDGWYVTDVIFDDGLSAAGAAAVTAAGLSAGMTATQAAGAAAVTAAGLGAGVTADAEGTGTAAVTAAALGATVTGQSGPGVAAVAAQGLAAGGSAYPGTGAASATATAFNATARAGVKPTSRVYAVEAESRTIVVNEPSRTVVVEPESRVIYVPAKDEDA